MEAGFESFEVEEIRDKRVTKRGESLQVKIIELLIEIFRNHGILDQMEGIPRARKDLGAARELTVLLNDR